LCEETESIQREEYKSITIFYLRIIQNYYRFHDDDGPSEKEYDMLMICLIFNYLFEVEKKPFFGDADSTQSEDSDDEDHELEPHEFFGYPPFSLEHDIVLSDIHVLESNENVHNVPHPKVEVKSNAPLMSF
jgi:hypothetical protein